ncbi:hypothetical protein CYJ73_18330 [Gordonia terrae]|uniref:Uncharacterized protein n=1 Tax=Gordonia terrae TaxID=2055 RepID=A0A2I1R4P1_9ACTN|nr:hypothetical protein CYJ73_18330 [Gordonia terrae]
MALKAIELQLDSVSSGAPAAGSGESGWSEKQIDDRLAELHRDRATLLAHWGFQASTRPAGATACGNSQPCPVALGIVEKYP